MTSIPQVAEAMQHVLDAIAYTLGRTTGFVQRERKLHGASFAQTLVFSFLANPEAPGAELTHTAAAVGVTITESGVTQRVTPQAASVMHRVLAEAITCVLAAAPLASALLAQFSAVYREDSTVIALPAAVHARWRGGGNAHDHGTAARNLTVRVDVRSGLRDGLRRNAGRTAAAKAAAPRTRSAAGAWYLADLGCFGLRRLRSLDAQGACFVARLHAQVTLVTPDGQRWDAVAARLATPTAAACDLAVELGGHARRSAHLVAVRAPQAVVDQRRRRLRAEAKRRGRTVSARQRARVAGMLFVTNVPVAQLRIKAVLVLARTRWQIERVCKRGKSQGKRDESRSAQPERVVCAVDAKLRAMLLQQWVRLIRLWGYRDRRLRKAMQVVQKYARQLAARLADSSQICATVATIVRVIARTCRMGRRRKRSLT